MTGLPSSKLSATKPKRVPIVCFNVNPAVERTCIVDRFAPGEVNRTTKTIVTASGKAATVARTIVRLGLDAIQVGPVAGEVGQAFVRLVAAEGLKGDWRWVDGETRTNITVVAADGSPDTILNEPGPTLTAADWGALTESLRLHSQPGSPVCISGSMPAGVQAGQLTELVVSLRERDVPVFVDSHGWALEALLQGQPWCAKVNHHEVAALLGRPIESAADAGIAARELLATVEGVVIITMGAAGAVFATAAEVAQVTPPPVVAVSGVGSGDTFLGALVAAIHTGRDVTTAVLYAAAAGAVNATSTRQGCVDPEAVEAAMLRGSVHRLDGTGGR